MTEDQQAALDRLAQLRKRRHAASMLFVALDRKVQAQRRVVDAALGVEHRPVRKRPAKKAVAQ